MTNNKLILIGSVALLAIAGYVVLSPANNGDMQIAAEDFLQADEANSMAPAASEGDMDAMDDHGDMMDDHGDMGHMEDMPMDDHGDEELMEE